MRNQKLHALVLIIFALTGLVWAGGNTETPAPSGSASGAAASAPVTIQYMTLQGSTIFQAQKVIIDNFQKANPNITVSATSIPSTADFQTALKTKFAAGTPPDVYQYQAGAALTQFAALDYLYDMTDEPYIKNTLAENFKITSYKGRIYGFPVDYQTAGLFVNQEVLKKYPGVKIPENWGEFVASLTQLQKAGLAHPLMIAGKDINNVSQFDFQYISENLLFKQPNYYKDLVTGKAKLNGPLFRTMFEKFNQIKKFMSPDSVGVDNDEAMKRFIRGNAAFWIAHGSTVSRLRQLGGPEFDFVIVPSVLQENTADRALLIGPVATNSIVKQTAHLDAARAFVAYNASKAAGEIMVTQGGILTTIIGVTAVPDPAYQPLLPWINGEPGKHVTPVGPDLVWVPGIKDVMKSITQKWFMGTSIDDVLNEWETEHRKLLKASPDYIENMDSQPF